MPGKVFTVWTVNYVKKIVAEHCEVGSEVIKAIVQMGRQKGQCTAVVNFFNIIDHPTGMYFTTWVEYKVTGYWVDQIHFYVNTILKLLKNISELVKSARCLWIFWLRPFFQSIKSEKMTKKWPEQKKLLK